MDRVREEIKKLESADEEQKEGQRFTHNEDYSSIVYKGVPYLPTEKQAEIIKLLDLARLGGHPVVSRKKILAQLGGESIRDSFRSRHPELRGNLIQKVKGGFRLNI